MMIHLFLTLLFVAERKQIVFMAVEKSPMRISRHLFVTSRSEMMINMIILKIQKTLTPYTTPTIIYIGGIKYVKMG